MLKKNMKQYVYGLGRIRSSCLRIILIHNDISAGEPALKSNNQYKS